MNWKEEVRKCKKSFPYYAEKYLKIRNFANELVPLKFNDIQRDYLWSYIKRCLKRKVPVRINHLKSRRIGGSTFYEALMFHDIHFNELSENLVVAQDLESSEFLHGMCKLFHDELPDELRPSIKRSNRRELVLKTTRSRMFVDTADNIDVGRSKQLKMAHCSEVAFWSSGKDKEIMIALEQTIPELPGTMIVYETTGKGVSGEFYTKWWEVEDVKKSHPDLSIWENIFIPWFAFGDYQRKLPKDYKIEKLDEEERELVRQFPFLTSEQLYWRRYTIFNKCRNSISYFKQEYPATAKEAFMYASSNIFPVEILERMKRTVKPQKFQGKIYKGELVRDVNGELIIWEFPGPYRNYVIGADIAEGIGQDDSVAFVLDIETFEQVAEYVSDDIRPEEFAIVLDILGHFYNIAEVGCEVNNHGYTTVKELIERNYPRLYKRKVHDKNRKQETTKVGWRTTKQSKPLMEDDLESLLSYGEIHFNSPKLIHQCQFYVEHPGGMTGASSGMKDDRVTAGMLAVQVAYGRYSKRKLKQQRERREDKISDLHIIDQLASRITVPSFDESSPAPLSFRSLSRIYNK